MVRPLPVSKLKARRRKQRLVLVVVSVLAVVLLCGGIVGLSWLPQIRVTTVAVVGQQSVSLDAIEKVVTDVLAGTYFYVIPRNNVFVYPQEEIRTALLKKFTALSSVVVHAENFNALGVDVVERTPQSLWCGSSVASSSPCFLVDTNGAVYAPAADFSGDVYIKYFGATVPGVPPHFLTPEQFRALFALTTTLKAQETTGIIASVEVDTEDTVRVQFDDGFTLIFSLTDSGADVLDRFNLALSAEPFSSHTLGDFSYLDLRFGDKLYYKLKTASQDAVASSTPGY